MASILDRYGIKEVADVTFWHLNEHGEPDFPVLYLDTLKVSTIEQTASTADATGGKGNAKLVSWDYGKEINVTLEDALFSPKSMSLMFSGSKGTIDTTAKKIKKTINYLNTTDGATLPQKLIKQEDGTYRVATTEEITNGGENLIVVDWYKADAKDVKEGKVGDTDTAKAGERFIGVYVVDVAVGNGKTITIDAAHFPGTYRVVGDTYSRSEASGEDEFFQFVIYKAKVSAENTITLQADGDPSTFNLNLTVLRNSDGKMMDLIQYKV